MAPPGRRKLPCLSALLLFVLLLFSTNAHAASAVLGIDLGTEYFKAAVAKPGSPIDIVLSKDSKRREAATLAFKPARLHVNNAEVFPERLYGGDAVALSARFPTDVYPNLKSLLGVESSSDAVTTYSARYPGLDIQPVPRSDAATTVGFKSHSFGKRDEVFMVEELLAMELKNIRGNAETMVPKGTFITDVVITYPAFYTAEEKRAIELAADLAGIRVLGLISDGLAVGLNYATHRTFDSVSEGGKPEHHLVYDMGAGSTTATVLKFQGRTVKGYAKRNQTIQEVIVLGTGFDTTLGGDSLNDVIVADIVSQFLESPKVQKFGLDTAQIRANGKTMNRIWKEAERMRQLLSANAVSSATFEGLYDEDITFKYSLTREKFEELATDHAARVGSPVSAALDSAGLTLDDIDSIILHGGAVRTPFVQKQLEKATGGTSKLKSNVNADEAAVMGAGFKAASLSPSFRVKDIRDTDISGSTYTLKWTHDSKEKSQKLFTPTSLVGTEKQVPIKVLEDVKLGFVQGVNEKDLPVLEVEATNLTKSTAQLKDKHGCTAANISTVFNIRLSPSNGLPEVLAGSVSCEANGTKSGSVMDNVKGLFGFGSNKDDSQKVLDDEDASEDSSASLTPLPASDPTSSGSTVSEASATPADASSASASSSASKSATSGKATPSVVTIPLALKSNVVGLNAPPAQALPKIRQRLTQFDTSDQNSVLRAEALNTLEAFTYRARDYLEDQSFIGASSESVRKELEKQLSSVSEWLYGDGLDASLQDFKDKLKGLQSLVNPVLKRKDEAAKRPDAVKALQEQIENLTGMIQMVEGNIKKAVEDAASSVSSAASSVASSVTGSSLSAADADDLDDDPYGGGSASTPEAAAETEESGPKPYEYTKEDLSLLTTNYEKAKAWLEEKMALQDKLGPSDEPVFSVSELETRGKELQKVVQDMILKTIKFQDLPKKAKGGSKKGKGKAKKSKATSGTSDSAGSSAGGSTSTPAASATATKSSVKDEL
ncbi:hypoxia up-regulated 1 [Exophiala viscosa]|uniref:Hypoxia up-regulated 1 n=1 Tax=Exophiala viscosa TaxID=2486360 RepID=A0AAN6E0Y2_9EURO|nr:hypoxia up-regulated 1 [Exophiala viscosa]KAI1624071.1 hypoxia up-regulated 1 [Exophiala viscosa]